MEAPSGLLFMFLLFILKQWLGLQKSLLSV